MHWITASSLMFASSVVFYSLARKASLIKLPTEFINFSSSSVAIVLYFLIAHAQKDSLTISWQGLLIIFLLSIFGSYLPNVASFESIKYAPNPGYSLMISKSYVVFTTLVAVLFFSSPLTLKSAFAIILIVGFSVLIMVGKSKPHKLYDPKWLPLAFVAFFGWGILSIGSKYVFTIGVTVPQRLLYLSVFITAYALGEIIVKKKKINNFSPMVLALMVAIGVFFSAFNYFMFVAIDKSPNIGYVNAINASSISAVTIAASILFKDEFSVKKFIGIVGVILGLIILII